MKQFTETNLLWAYKYYKNIHKELVFALLDSYNAAIKDQLWNAAVSVSIAPPLILHQIIVQDMTFGSLVEDGYTDMSIVYLRRFFQTLSDVCKFVCDPNNRIFKAFEIPAVPAGVDDTPLEEMMEELDTLYPGLYDMYKSYQVEEVKMEAKQQIKDMCWLNKVILDIIENYKKELKLNKRMPILHTPNENRNC